MNPFWLLCVTLSLAVFFLAGAAGTLLANTAAWLSWRFGNKSQLLHSPGLLFTLRMFPLAFGAAITLGFALPSFLLLEPERSAEAPEPYLIAFACLAVAAVGSIAIRWLYLLSRSVKTVRKLKQGAELLRLSFSIPVYRVQSPESLIAVVGIFSPKVFVGTTAIASLSCEELQAAIAHELAHVRSLDNLKQLLLTITRLPQFFASLAKVDTQWSAAAELMADTNALRQGTSPLELSSAIVKVGRLRSTPSPVFSVPGCHLIPPDGSSCLAIRIQHLHDALDAPSKPTTQHPDFRWFLFLLGTTGYLLVLPAALPVVHRWMEWLVK